MEGERERMPADGQQLPVCPKCRSPMEPRDSAELRLEMSSERFYVFRCPSCATWFAEPAEESD
jgi:RNase P subunit RPR2